MTLFQWRRGTVALQFGWQTDFRCKADRRSFIGRIVSLDDPRYEAVERVVVDRFDEMVIEAGVDRTLFASSRP